MFHVEHSATSAVKFHVKHSLSDAEARKNLVQNHFSINTASHALQRPGREPKVFSEELGARIASIYRSC